MKPPSIHIVRVGLGVTFLWIGVLIFRDPEVWSRLLAPWVADLVPVPLKATLISIAIFDFIVGFFLLVDLGTLFFSSLALIHFLAVVVVVGITSTTVRDIGLAAASLSLVFAYWPKHRGRNNQR